MLTCSTFEGQITLTVVGREWSDIVGVAGALALDTLKHKFTATCTCNEFKQSFSNSTFHNFHLKVRRTMNTIIMYNLNCRVSNNIN